MKKTTIEIPEGYELKKTEKDGKIIYEMIECEKSLPKSWNELDGVRGWVVTLTSGISPANHTRPDFYNRNIWPTKELAEAAIALAQLTQLQDIYNDG